MFSWCPAATTAPSYSETTFITTGPLRWPPNQFHGIVSQQTSEWHVGITKTCLFKYTENFTTKKWKFSDKKNDIFHISAQNIDCRYSLEPPRWVGYNEYPQSMFLSRNKENNIYPCKPHFYHIKVGFKGSKLHRIVFVMDRVRFCFVAQAHPLYKRNSPDLEDFNV